VDGGHGRFLFGLVALRIGAPLMSVRVSSLPMVSAGNRAAAAGADVAGAANGNRGRVFRPGRGCSYPSAADCLRLVGAVRAVRAVRAVGVADAGRAVGAVAAGTTGAGAVSGAVCTDGSVVTASAASAGAAGAGAGAARTTDSGAADAVSAVRGEEPAVRLGGPAGPAGGGAVSDSTASGCGDGGVASTCSPSGLLIQSCSAVWNGSQKSVWKASAIGLAAEDVESTEDAAAATGSDTEPAI